MADFKQGLLTVRGMSLLSRAHAGLVKIEFTKAATGDGSYTEEEDLYNRGDLKSKRQEFPISTISVVNENTTEMTLAVTNKSAAGTLDQGYYIKEVGIYANDPEGGEILYAIAIAEDGRWDYMPAFSEGKPSTSIINMITEVANAPEVTIQVTDALNATIKDVENLIRDHNLREDSHPYILEMLAQLDARLTLIELMYNTDVSGNPFTVTFPALNDVNVTGVWNKPAMRIEF